MSLGRRTARHETVAAARTAGVSPEDYWSFKPGQKVMTADGFPGVVAAVDDGPIAGVETYEVTLDNGMGGGQYTASLLRAMPQSTANVEQKTAADDYPELGTILVDRPPLALSVASSLQVQAWDNSEWDEAGDHEDTRDTCGSCQGVGEVAGSTCGTCEGSGREDIHKGASLQVEADLDDQIKVPEPRHNQTFPISSHKPSAAEYVRGFTEGHGSGVSGSTRADLEHRGPYSAYEHGLVHGHNAANGAQGLYQHLQSATDALGMNDGGNLANWLTENNHSHGRTASLQAEAAVGFVDPDADPHCKDCKGRGEVPSRNYCGDTCCSPTDTCECVWKNYEKRSDEREAYEEHDKRERNVTTCDFCEGKKKVKSVSGHKSLDCPGCQGSGEMTRTACRTRRARIAAFHKGAASVHTTPTYTDPVTCSSCGTKNRFKANTYGTRTCEQCGNRWTIPQAQRPDAHGRTASLQAEASYRSPTDDEANAWHDEQGLCRASHSYVPGNAYDAKQPCPTCGQQVEVRPGSPDLGDVLVMPHPAKTAAYDHGDKDKYTSGHKCPNCASDRSLESANGVIKCEDCGYEEQNGQIDGWGDGKTSMLVTAVQDPEFRFHVMASYSDVRSKAKRIRSEGKVSIISVVGGTVVANVKGDTAVYETEIVRMGSNAIAQWHCGCKWGSYAWGRSPAFKRFEGRLCSHALALHFEAQSQGMFGRSLQEEEKSPGWLKPRTRVVVDFDKDRRSNVSRPAQPRKRDTMRSYAMVQSETSPVEVFVKTSLLEGVSQEEILVSLACAGIDAREMFALAASPDGYQKTEPGSHHKDRSGDLAPCARGGCGHPEGIHGEEGGHCASQGCECKHYQGVGAPKEARRHKKKRKSKRHARAMHYGAPWHGIGWGLGGWGGWGGYYGPGEGGGSGGDGGGGDGGGGDSSAARGEIFPVFKLASPFPDTMDPTYTPGNDVRPHDGSHGVWTATSPADPNANPGSTGYASQGDPKEFRQDSSAFGRMGSLETLAWNPVKPLWNKIPDKVKGIGWGGGKDHGRDLRGGGVLPDDITQKNLTTFNDGATIDQKNPVTRAVNKVEDTLTFTDDIADWVGDKGGIGDSTKKAPGPITEVVDHASSGIDKARDVARSTWKKLFGSLDADVTAALRAEGFNPINYLDDAARGVQKGLSYGDDAWRLLPDAIPGAGPKVKAPTKPGEPQTPNAPVPGKPGVGTPAAPKSVDPKLQPKMKPQGDKPGGKPTGPKADQAPSGKKGDGKGKSSGPKPKGRGGMPFMIPILPQFQRPDYYQESNALIGGHGIGSRSSLVADLLREAALTDQQEFANGVADNLEALGGPSLDRYTEADDDLNAITQQEAIKERAHGRIDVEAELHVEPEAALPQTDGETVDPDGDVEGLASQGSVDDIVAQFQATAGAAALAGGGSTSPSEGGSDVAAAAKAFLAKESMKSFSPTEQKSIIDEGMDVTAANLDRLNIEGTHYEALEAALASQTDDDDLEF